MIFILILIASIQLKAQNKIVKLIHADSLVGRTYDSKTVRELIGNVKLKHENIFVSCDRAIQYVDENRIEAYGSLKIIQDTLLLTADKGIYLGDSKISICEGNVKLTDGKTTLTAEYGNYNAEKKVANFKFNVKLIDTTVIITSNQLFYYRNEKKTIATGNVVIKNIEDNITIYGNYFENYDSARYSIIKNNPKLVQIDTTADGDIDTLIVIGKFMEAFRDTNVSLFSASDSVVIVRGDLSAICGDVLYYDKEEIIILDRNPIIWYEDSQITGDSVVIRLKDRRLYQVDIYGSAFAISTSDSAFPNRFNQLKGKIIRIKFDKNEISEIFVENNAVSLYYLFDTDENNSIIPNGVNRVSGDSIWIKFEDGKIKQIKITGGIEGIYYPEKMVQGREDNFNLEGFNYIERKPKKNKKLEIVWRE